MATLYRETDLNAPADEVWNALADVGALNTLITFLGDVTVEGEERVCSLGDDKLRELIVTVDDEHRRVAYSVQESPFNFAHHHSSMQVIPNGETTKFVWWTDVKPDETAPVLAQAIDQSVDSIRQAIDDRGR